METTKVISENENYTAVNIGSMDELMEHTLVHPVSGR
ncbi:MAG: cupin domain-containing protein, partial [Bacteroides oleiciplenus]|nr:cupin domain-containing protein [Bacteroides oleiciplenus]